MMNKKISHGGFYPLVSAIFSYIMDMGYLPRNSAILHLYQLVGIREDIQKGGSRNYLLNLNLKVLTFIILITLSISIVSCKTVAIDASKEYQTIEGFGGNWDGVIGLIDGIVVDLSVANLVFNDLGLSISRQGPPDDFRTDPNYSRQLKSFIESKARGIETFFAAATTPRRFREPKSSRLLPQYYTDYANYLADWLEDVKNQTGVEVTYFSPQTEPDNWWAKGVGSGQFTPQELTDFIKVLGPVFESRGISTNISTPETFATNRIKPYLRSLLNDPGALQYIDVINYHVSQWEAGANSPRGESTISDLQYIGNVGSAYSIPTMMTEMGIGGELPQFKASPVIIAKWIHYALTYANSIGWLWERIVSSAPGGLYFPLVLLDTSGGKPYPGSITKIGYQFKQFSKYIKPGTIRVSADSGDGHVLVSAFKHPTHNTFALVAINDGIEDKLVEFNIYNLNTISTLTVSRTSATENTTDLGSISLTGNSFLYPLPRESTTTFIGPISGSPKSAS